MTFSAPFPPPPPEPADDGRAARIETETETVAGVEGPPNDPAADRRSSIGFALIAAVAALAAISILTVALARSADQASDDVVLEAADLVAEAPPATIPPVAIETAPEPSNDQAATNTEAGGDQREASADPELSPLAELLGPRYSTIPEEIQPRPRPVGVSADRIAIGRYPIRAVGLEDDGQLEVPDETEIGWYRYGATAGRPGATVLAAHVSWNDTTGPFFRLGSMEPGDRVTVELDDGSSREYEVTERTMYDKDELPRNRIWRNTGPETLVLITCGGDFNPDIRRYRQNIVVYAVPVAFTEPTFN